VDSDVGSVEACVWVLVHGSSLLVLRIYLHTPYEMPYDRRCGTLTDDWA